MRHGTAQFALMFLSLLGLRLATPPAARAQDAPPVQMPSPSAPTPAQDSSVEPITQNWNIHGQVTETPQGDTAFPALYSGPNSLDSKGEVQETFTADLYAGARLWKGAEIHVDGLLWKGFGLTNDKGIEAFPNGDAFKLGTKNPHFMFAHLFLRETIGLGGKREPVPDSPLTLAGEQDISRLTITLGRLTPTDMFDNNAYAQDPHTQFMNWAMITNLSWDFAADSVGYTTGLVVELNQPRWSLAVRLFPGAEHPKWLHGRGPGSHFSTWGRRRPVFSCVGNGNGI